MDHVFVTPAGRALPRWRAAFENLRVVAHPDLIEVEVSPSDSAGSLEVLCWIELDALSEVSATHDRPSSEMQVRSLADRGFAVIALTGTPCEPQAFSCLAMGARGYCHAQAAPELLREVAQAVTRGNLWMPPDLLGRIATLAQRIDTPSAGAQADLSALTPREEQAALLVGRGLSNREIAAAMGVSERTVKANLTMTFEKLGLRDRVQLALYVNRLPVP
ncbi:MAG: response regulator transcription factor [Pseudomonadota bacterium]